MLGFSLPPNLLRQETVTITDRDNFLVLEQMARGWKFYRHQKVTLFINNWRLWLCLNLTGNSIKFFLKHPNLLNHDLCGRIETDESFDTFVTFERSGNFINLDIGQSKWLSVSYNGLWAVCRFFVLFVGRDYSAVINYVFVLKKSFSLLTLSRCHVRKRFS